jgi:predicted phosphodiesterase
VIDIICKESNKEKSILVLPGDICDSFRISDRLKSLLINAFLKARDEYNVHILAIAGQHDQRYHTTNIENTPINVLASARALTLIPPEGVNQDNTIMFYGCNWGEEDKLKQVDEKLDLKILVIHQMISDKDYWHNHVEYMNSYRSLYKYGYDLIISGDNHNTFTSHDRDRHLINCGSWIRSRIDQVDHKPVVFLYNTNTNLVSKHYIPCLPVDQVLKMAIRDQITRQNASLDDFSTALESNFDSESESLDFVKKLRQVIKKLEVDSEVSDIIFEAVKKAEGIK